MAQKFSSGLTGLNGTSIQSPFGAALQNKISPSPLQPLNTGLKGLSGGSVASPFQGSTGTQPKPMTPTAPVGNQSGNQSISPGSTSQPAPVFNPTTAGSGFINSSGNYNSPTNTQYTPTVSPGDQGTPRASNPFINSLNTQQSYANGQGNTDVNRSIGGLQGISQNQTPAVNQSQGEYNTFAKQSPLLLSDVRNNPNVAAEVSVGRGQALGQTLSAEQQALSQNVSNALAGQGQQITAGTNAGQMAQSQQTAQIGAAQNVGGLSQPQAGAAFYGSPVTGNVVGNTSTQGGGFSSTGNSLIDSSVNNAVMQALKGGTTSDSMATLSSLGAPAQQAFISAMQKLDPNWTITGSNATAQQNWNQVQKYQGVATDLDTGLKQLDKASTLAQNFINGEDLLNPTANPHINDAINTYIGTFKNPADRINYQMVLSDVKKFQSQILASDNGTIPTDITKTLNNVDPSTLSAPQLQSWIKTLNQLGNNQLSTIQKQVTDIMSGGQKPYTGTQTTTNTNPNYGPTTTKPLGGTTLNQAGQALGGLGLNASGEIMGLTSGLTKAILEL